MAGFLGKGNVYVDRDINNKFISIGNATRFAINETEVDVKERFSRQLDSYGQALDSVAINKPPKISIEIDEARAENLALALKGTIEVVDVASGSVSGESITAAHDAYVALEYENVSNVVVKDETDTTTYTEGTDYEVNTRMGWIKVLSTGSIADGDTLHVSYDYGAKKAYKIKGSKQAEILCQIVLDGENVVNNKRCRVKVYQAKVRPSAEVDFLADDYVKISLEGTLVTPEDKTEPYIVEYDV